MGSGKGGRFCPSLVQVGIISGEITHDVIYILGRISGHEATPVKRIFESRGSFEPQGINLRVQAEVGHTPCDFSRGSNKVKIRLIEWAFFCVNILKFFSYRKTIF